MSIDINQLFVEFDFIFFESIVSKVFSLSFSNKLVSKAGICDYKNCIIKLNRNLLDYLNEKSVKEVLLHEMVHAYIYLAHRSPEHLKHGKLFKKYSKIINETLQINITVTHNYHETSQ